MKLIPDKLDAFLQFDDIVSIDGSIRSKTNEIVNHLDSDFGRAKAIFEWVSPVLGYAYWNFGLEVAILAHAIGLLLSWLFWAVIHKIKTDHTKTPIDV